MKMGSECSGSGGLDIVIAVNSLTISVERVPLLYPVLYILVAQHCCLSSLSRPLLMVRDNSGSKLQFDSVTSILRRHFLALVMLAQCHQQLDIANRQIQCKCWIVKSFGERLSNDVS